MRAPVILLISAFLIAVCRPGIAVAQKNSDDQIYDKVRQRLASNRDVKGGGIQVDVREGVVTLRGTVREEKQKVKAEQITRKTKGVKKVVNQLEVELPPAARGTG